MRNENGQPSSGSSRAAKPAAAPPNPEIWDEPGALGKVALRLAEANINVEYAYATAASGGAVKALCIFKVADPVAADVALSIASEV